MSVETPICSICQRPIPVKGTWRFGNNAEPINDGRCCYECDDLIVLPARMRRMYETTVKKAREGLVTSTKK